MAVCSEIHTKLSHTWLKYFFFAYLFIYLSYWFKEQDGLFVGSL